MSQGLRKGVNILSMAEKDGSFKRRASVFRDVISKNHPRFKPEKGRYHVYISLGCPWAHRVLIYLTTKGLVKDFNPETSEVSEDSVIGLSVVHWGLDSKGWRFPTKEKPTPGSTKDHVYGHERLSDLYYKADSKYEGRFTVPIVWDEQNETIVSNESSEIIRFLNSEFNEFIEDPKKKELNYYPNELQLKIDELNSWIYDGINNAVYKTGFATKQEAYDSEVTNLFKHLEKLEGILEENHGNGTQYLVSNQLTEADIRLFTTIIRFDVSYYTIFKCNIGSIRSDFPYIHRWLRTVYWRHEDIKKTVNFEHIKNGYSHIAQNNPTLIVPL